MRYYLILNKIKSKFLSPLRWWKWASNVPNATIIIIEGAERFGLTPASSVKRTGYQKLLSALLSCFCRIKVAKNNRKIEGSYYRQNGFELAEYDLKIRGAGELGGGKQWGVSDIGMEALKNIKMVEDVNRIAKNNRRKPRF